MYFFSFIYGSFAAVCALIAQMIIDSALPSSALLALTLKSASPSSAIAIILFVALIEECAKFIAVRSSAFTQPCRAYIHAFFIGLGFTAIEFSLIALTSYTAPPSLSTTLGYLAIHICSPLIITTLLFTLRNWHIFFRTLTILTITTLLHSSYNILAYVGYAPTSLPQILFLGALIIATIMPPLLILYKFYGQKTLNEL